LTAVCAAAASAHTFKTTSSPTFLNGEQVTKNVFTFSGGAFKCTGATFTSAELTGTSLSSVVVHPTYIGCTAFGQEFEITTGTSTNGCNYEFTTEGKVSVKCVGSVSAMVRKAKTAGRVITVNGRAENQNLGSVTYANQTDGGLADALATAQVTGITYTSSGGICGASGTAGGYTGSVLDKGYSNSAHTTQHSVSWE
jgi:hypothetical protein